MARRHGRKANFFENVIPAEGATFAAYAGLTASTMLKSIWWLTPFFFPRWRGGQAFHVAAAGDDLSAINASSLTVKRFLDMQDDNLPKLVVCQSLSVMQGVTYEQFEWFVRQSEEQISL